MSKFIPTSIGLFRHVDDSGQQRFLFQCHDCGEWLPMPEEVLSGELGPIHELRVNGVGQARYCSFSAAQVFGAALVSTMQARILMEEKPFVEYEYAARQEVVDLGGRIYAAPKLDGETC